MFAGFLFNSVRFFEFQTSDKFTLVECNNGRYGVKFSFGMFDSKMTIKNRYTGIDVNLITKRIVFFSDLDALNTNICIFGIFEKRLFNNGFCKCP